MIYTAIDSFYVNEDLLRDSPSRKDGIDEATETSLRIYGCDLIQESGILLRFPQAVMATGQVLFHRFYCKKSFCRFNVKKVAASCVWLASKLEEIPRKARQIIIVFHRIECRRENLPIEFLDLNSKKFSDLKAELSRTERHILMEMGFVCHVEHPHKFISNYLATLETPPELRQEAWNLANDSLRTTLCVRFKSEVVACGVVYAASRRFQVPLPEDPPWWEVFDADKSGIDEVCRVLAHLYSLPKAKYIAVSRDGDFSFSVKPSDSQLQSFLKEDVDVSVTVPTEGNCQSRGSKVALIKAALDKLKESKKSDDESKTTEQDSIDEPIRRFKSDNRMETSYGKNKDKDKDREKEKMKAFEHDRGRHVDRDREEREETGRDRDKAKDRSHHSKDKGKESGHLEKPRHRSSRDSDHHSSLFSAKDKDRHRHHSHA